VAAAMTGKCAFSRRNTNAEIESGGCKIGIATRRSEIIDLATEMAGCSKVFVIRFFSKLLILFNYVFFADI
jgi:hypothetical protein